METLSRAGRALNPLSLPQIIELAYSLKPLLNLAEEVNVYMIAIIKLLVYSTLTKM